MQTFHTKQGRKKVEVRAVDGVDLDVAEGEVVGFLGPNGAGKTTTLRMLTTLLRPTAGTATVAGYDVVSESEQVRRSIGYVSQAGGAFSGARAGDEVIDHGMLYGHERGRRPSSAARSSSTSSTCDGLWHRMPKNDVRRPEAPPRHRDGPDPRARRLVFLDEPTTGLDPQARANLWEHIADLRDRRGATVFLTTHYLDEADALSDRILDHRPRQDRRRRHLRQPQGAGRRRPRRPRGRRRRPTSPTARRRELARSADGADVEVDGQPRPRPGASAPAAPSRACCATSTGRHRPRLDRGAPPDPRRRLPHPDRPLAARRRPRPAPRVRPRRHPRRGADDDASCARATSSSAGRCG